MCLKPIITYTHTQLKIQKSLSIHYTTLFPSNWFRSLSQNMGFFLNPPNISFYCVYFACSEKDKQPESEPRRALVATAANQQEVGKVHVQWHLCDCVCVCVCQDIICPAVCLFVLFKSRNQRQSLRPQDRAGTIIYCTCVGLLGTWAYVGSFLLLLSAVEDVGKGFHPPPPPHTHRRPHLPTQARRGSVWICLGYIQH